MPQWITHTGTPCAGWTRVVDVDVLQTPGGPVQRVTFTTGQPPEDRLDLKLTVQTYRQVSALTPTTEVLVCGHEHPRFDLTPAGTALAQQKAARFPRTRRCAVCTRHLVRADLARLTHDGSPAGVQLAAEWGGLTKQERHAAAPLLRQLAALAGGPDISQWTKLSPAQRTQIAEAGEQFAQHFGLTFRELMGLRAAPAPEVTPAGLRRLNATPAEKRKRARQRDERYLAREWQRDHE